MGLMKDELGRNITKKFVGLIAKAYSYLIDNNDKDKKEKQTKEVCHQKYFKIRDHKNCLKASKIGNKINYLEKKKIDTDCFNEDKREFVKNNKLILKTQVSKSERHNIFTEEINKIALSSNDDKKYH